MSDTVIQVENLGKKYRLSHQVSGVGLRHAMQDAVTASFRFFRKGSSLEAKAQPSATEEFWALQDVSFTIDRGDVIGIIGRNGAGKSTLLKILSRITEPTRGRITIDGRISSLLEVGTGFHYELTGRENIFLNGAILGMSRAEVHRKLDEIISFAEVEKFLDTPVKHYSSGMYVRLAFAVAAHLEPEILIVDEVLAVGDVPFQQKCLGKMEEASRQKGRTVLFVSHNMPAILQLTSRCIVLDHGKMLFHGPTHRAVEIYNGSFISRQEVVFNVEHAYRKHKASLNARILQLRFNRSLPVFSFGEDFRFFVKMRARDEIPQIRVGLTLFTAEGIPIGTCFTPDRSGLCPGEEIEVEAVLPNLRLAPGNYHCGVTIGKGDHRTVRIDFDIVCDTLPFQVLPEAVDMAMAFWYPGWGSLVLPDFTLAN